MKEKVPKYNGKPNEVDEEFEKFTIEQIEKFEEKMQEYEIANALQEIWTLISRTNKYIDRNNAMVISKRRRK